MIFIKTYIELKNINKSFLENKVLENFNAKFPIGEKSSIMAPSGKGKTTILNILLNLTPIDSGEIIGISDKKVSAVFQEDRLIDNLSALNNILIVSSFSKEEVSFGLKEMGLSDFINSPTALLSGGMKRRVAILRALFSDSDVLIFDEPFKGLDEDTKNIILEVVKKYSINKTLILVTHIKKEAEDLGCTYNITL